MDLIEVDLLPHHQGARWEQELPARVHPQACTGSRGSRLIEPDRGIKDRVGDLEGVVLVVHRLEEGRCHRVDSSSRIRRGRDKHRVALSGRRARDVGLDDVNELAESRPRCLNVCCCDLFESRHL